jgi:SAM-dependent methyltransferase
MSVEMRAPTVADQQRRNSLYGLLGLSSFYRCFQGLTWSRSGEDFLINYGQPLRGEKVLDIGCGPGDQLARLPEIDYTGFDLNPEYIEAATRRHGLRGRFFCGDVGSVGIDSEKGSYDLVMAYGVLHHVDDERAQRLFALAHEMLKPGGRLVTADGCYTPDQSKVARWLISRDRGQFVRDRQHYLRLAATSFTTITATVRHDLLRIPWTHILLRCEK